MRAGVSHEGPRVATILVRRTAEFGKDQVKCAKVGSVGAANRRRRNVQSLTRLGKWCDCIVERAAGQRSGLEDFHIELCEVWPRNRRKSDFGQSDIHM